jgi:prefoldin alpha subunit
MAVLQQYQAQLEAYARQEEVLRVTLEEFVRARETMARYQQADKGAEVLVPIGANSFVYAEVGNPDRVIVGIGSNVSVEEGIPTALEKLEARIKDIEGAREGTLQRLVELQAKAEEQGRVVEGLYAKLQSQGGGE